MLWLCSLLTSLGVRCAPWHRAEALPTGRGVGTATFPKLCAAVPFLSKAAWACMCGSPTRLVQCMGSAGCLTAACTSLCRAVVPVHRKKKKRSKVLIVARNGTGASCSSGSGEGSRWPSVPAAELPQQGWEQLQFPKSCHQAGEPQLHAAASASSSHGAASALPAAGGSQIGRSQLLDQQQAHRCSFCSLSSNRDGGNGWGWGLRGELLALGSCIAKGQRQCWPPLLALQGLPSWQQCQVTLCISHPPGHRHGGKGLQRDRWAL